ncbi:hypothetical protein FHG87_007069 [Trinorchestia longiramus]|nr:hypothetical protein FHG87_007069 [Trinorchestia longiramus]
MNSYYLDPSELGILQRQVPGQSNVGFQPIGALLWESSFSTLLLHMACTCSLFQAIRASLALRLQMSQQKMPICCSTAHYCYPLMKQLRFSPILLSKPSGRLCG